MTNNLISRQAAIDGVKTLHDVAWKNWHEPTLSANVVLDMIRELPSVQPEVLACGEEVLNAQPERWIPVSERLPEESGTYIVTAYDGATERVTYAKYQKRLKRWELTGARAYWRVLAWMPLPEPYQAERREE